MPLRPERSDLVDGLFELLPLETMNEVKAAGQLGCQVAGGFGER